MTNCVLISEEDGNISDVIINIHRTSNDLFRVLKGTGTFIGQWPDINVVIMKCRESMFDLIENRNILPEPFDKETIIGPVLLVRMDENSEPQDFTLQEYLDFLGRNPCPA